MSGKYDWDEIFAKWKTGNYSWPELAEEYGFNPSYASRKANEEGITKGESKSEVMSLARKKRTERDVIDDEAERVAQINERIDSYLDNLFAILHNETIAKIADGDNPDFQLLKSLKIASEIIKNIRSEQYEVNDIQEVAEKVEQEIYGKDGGDIEVSYEKTEEALEQFRETLGNLRAEN